jgi:GGDEF domain-containing protein
MMCLEGFVFGRGHAYRQGGDDYTLLLPGFKQKDAEEVLDSLRLRVADLKYPEVPAHTTISIGLCVEPNESESPTPPLSLSGGLALVDHIEHASEN